MSYRNARTPEELRAAVDHTLRTNPDAAYYADFQVEASELVATLVPERNREALASNPWLQRVAVAFGSTELSNLDAIDPAYVFAWLGLTDPIAFPLESVAPIKSAPGRFLCSCCQDIRVPEGTSNTRLTLKVVRPVLLGYGARVIEILLCAECVDSLGVEPS